MNTMRRRDREVGEMADKLAIVEECDTCRVGMKDEEGMYIVPMNFGYECDGGRLTLYFHGSKDGRKVEAIKKDPEVCFEMDCAHELVTGEMACFYGFKYKSVFGTGRASFVEDIDEKKKALALIMRHYTDKEFEIKDAMVNCLTITKIDVETITGKARLK